MMCVCVCVCVYICMPYIIDNMQSIIITTILLPITLLFLIYVFYSSYDYWCRPLYIYSPSYIFIWYSGMILKSSFISVEQLVMIQLVFNSNVFQVAIGLM